MKYQNLQSERPIIVNPEAFIRVLGYLEKFTWNRTRMPKTRMPQARPNRNYICESCLYGQHQFCECKSCQCKGEFRMRKEA